jgi:N6-adenosine-specific RNA methylase IME4
MVAQDFVSEQNCCTETPRREHSRKPDEVYPRARGPYLEMFARSSQPGWDRWGLDADLREIRSPALACHELSGRAARAD